MRTVAFLVIVFIGVALVFSTHELFTTVGEESAQSSYRGALEVVAGKVVSTLELGYLQAEKSSLSSDRKPAANLSLNLPEKLGREEYFLEVNGSSVEASVGGTARLSRTLSFNTNTSAEIASQESGHRVIVYRLNSSQLRFQIY